VSTPLSSVPMNSMVDCRHSDTSAGEARGASIPSDAGNVVCRG